MAMVQNPGTPALSHQNSRDFWIFISRTAGMMKWQGVNTSEPQNFRSFPSIKNNISWEQFSFLIWRNFTFRSWDFFGFLGNIDEYWIEKVKIWRKITSNEPLCAPSWRGPPPRFCCELDWGLISVCNFYMV